MIQFDRAEIQPMLCQYEKCNHPSPVIDDPIRGQKYHRSCARLAQLDKIRKNLERVKKQRAHRASDDYKYFDPRSNKF